MINAERKADIAYKSLKGVASTSINRAYYEETHAVLQRVLSSQIWVQSTSIPGTAPGGTDGQITGVVQRRIDLVLTQEPGKNNAFYHADLIDAIEPEKFGSTYAYVLKDSLGNVIPAGSGDYEVNPDAGTVTFVDGYVPANVPISISFYKYVGEKGLGANELTGDEVDAIQGASSPSALNVFATMNDLPANELTSDQLAAVTGSASPSALNVFATMADIPADELTSDQLAAIDGAASPSAQNVFATIADLPEDELTTDQLAAITGSASPSASNVFATLFDISETIETVTKNVYYSTTGNDTTGDGTVGNPFASPLKCLQSLKKIINNGVIITITPTAGTYAVDGFALQKEIKKFVLLGTGQIIFTGGYTVLTNAFTLAAGNPSAYEYTISGATWTDNQYRDKLLRSAANNFYGIISNGTNTVRTLTGASAATEVVEFNVVWNITNNLYVHLNHANTNSSAAIIFELMQLNFSTTSATISVKNTLCNLRRCQIIAGSLTTYTNDLVTFNLVSMVFSSGGINVHKYGQLRNTAVRKSGTKTGTGITYDIDYYRNQHNVYIENYTTAIQSSASVVNWNQSGGNVVIDNCTNAFAVRMGSQVNFSSLAVLYITGVDYIVSAITDTVTYNYSVRVYSMVGTPGTDYLTSALKTFGYNNVERNINVLIPGVYTEESVGLEGTLNNNTSGNIVVGDITQNSVVMIDGIVKRGSLALKLNFELMYNGTALYLKQGDVFPYIEGNESLGITWDKDISENSVRLLYTVSNAVDNCKFTYNVRRVMLKTF